MPDQQPTPVPAQPRTPPAADLGTLENLGFIDPQPEPSPEPPTPPLDGYDVTT
ncbi:hypothetical protein [Streptomyces albireticuli]|uniref:hypothetical protein n=1 Tax=Streptomyces albireticuli TaxID=1940 RepID=UPI001473A813|nr:hypothetical protein [Streptomyces albireticuli]MCD9196089.1 hypothetical protein [Streptomyces albireticuli]